MFQFLETLNLISALLHAVVTCGSRISRVRPLPQARARADHAAGISRHPALYTNRGKPRRPVAEEEPNYPCQQRAVAKNCSTAVHAAGSRIRIQLTAMEPTLVGTPHIMAAIPTCHYGDPNGVDGLLFKREGKERWHRVTAKVAALATGKGPGSGPTMEAASAANLISSERLLPRFSLDKDRPRYSDEGAPRESTRCVELRIDVDATGARAHRVVHGLGLGLDERAGKRWQWKFKAGTG